MSCFWFGKTRHWLTIAYFYDLNAWTLAIKFFQWSKIRNFLSIWTVLVFPRKLLRKSFSIVFENFLEDFNEISGVLCHFSNIKDTSSLSTNVVASGVSSVSIQFVQICFPFQNAANLQQKDQLDLVAQNIASDNLELCCVFIQKTAVERALHETDKRLATVSNYIWKSTIMLVCWFWMHTVLILL